MLEALERDLPPATLLLGPGTGDLLWQVRQAVLQAQPVHVTDTLFRRHVSAADARNIVRFSQTAPFGPFKMIVAGLDGSTAQAQNILLKMLEEPPPSVRIILVAAERPLPTIVSRCQVIIVPGAGEPGEPDREVSAKVDSALRAAEAADLRGLDQALQGWGAAHHAALCQLLADASAGTDGRISLGRARKLLGALSRFDGASPRLAAHAALVTVLVP